jgi:hypothetical protein
MNLLRHSKGNASEYLRSHQDANKLRITSALHFYDPTPSIINCPKLLGITRGCQYLHLWTPPIIPGDLKGSNISPRLETFLAPPVTISQPSRMTGAD